MAQLFYGFPLGLTVRGSAVVAAVTTVTQGEPVKWKGMRGSLTDGWMDGCFYKDQGWPAFWKAQMGL